MDRRKSLKTLAFGSLGSAVLIDACTVPDKKAPEAADATKATAFKYDRMQEEKERDEKLLQEEFFNADEMQTITTLGDIIVPADDVSGSASQAGVPAFIAFIVVDMPQHQTPMRGGLRWLNLHSIKMHGKDFNGITKEQQIAIVDSIAYPAKASPELSQGVSFFNLMRNLTLTGFYTSEIGVKDLGYVGNRPNQWNGVPDDVLAEHKMAYTEKELKECISFSGNAG